MMVMIELKSFKEICGNLIIPIIYYLYVSHNENSHEERKGIKELFRNDTWATVDENRV